MCGVRPSPIVCLHSVVVPFIELTPSVIQICGRGQFLVVAYLVIAWGTFCYLWTSQNNAS